MCWPQSLALWRGKITGLGRYYSTLPNKACYQMLSPGCLPGQHTKMEQSVGWRKSVFEGCYSTLKTQVRELQYNVPFTPVDSKISTPRF